MSHADIVSGRLDTPMITPCVPAACPDVMGGGVVRRWGVALGAVVLGACVYSAPLIPVARKVTLSYMGFAVDGPKGWYRLGDGNVGEPLILTRDGLPLQFIRIERVSSDRRFTHDEKRVGRNMLLKGLAQLEADDLRSAPGVLDFEALENTPATVGGKPGFRLLCAWKTRDGLRLKRLHYGFLDGQWAYRLIYQAAARHYFDRDLAAFERVRESFRLLDPPT